MTLSSASIATFAASHLTTHRLAAVAADYLEWIEDQVDVDSAQSALLASCKVSKNPAKVLAAADVAYAGVEVPTITSTTPDTGDAAGAEAATIAGTNLTGTTGVTFGGVAATSVVVVSDISVTCVTPAHAAGAVNVVLTTPDGVATDVAGFTYEA